MGGRQINPCESVDGNSSDAQCTAGGGAGGGVCEVFLEEGMLELNLDE